MTRRARKPKFPKLERGDEVMVRASVVGFTQHTVTVAVNDDEHTSVVYRTDVRPLTAREREVHRG
jgi:hypothetical protein